MSLEIGRLFYCIISHTLLVCCPFEDPLDVQRAPLPLMASRMIVESLVNAKLEGKSLRSKPLWLKETESSFCWRLWFQPWKPVSHESVSFCPNWNISAAMGWIMMKLCTDIDISGVPRRLITPECCGCSVFLRESAGRGWMVWVALILIRQRSMWFICDTCATRPITSLHHNVFPQINRKKTFFFFFKINTMHAGRCANEATMQSRNILDLLSFGRTISRTFGPHMHRSKTEPNRTFSL